MVELVGKVSKGTRMDQIYIPKNRESIPVGSYVVIKPLEREKKEVKLFFYNVDKLEPVKVEIIKELIRIVDKHSVNENIIITGSFLDRGFRFNDIDILIIGGEIKKELLEKKIGIKVHLISITNKALVKGLGTDPLYRIMLSRCISKKRLIYKTKTRVNYKLLDLHLLKSKPLTDDFDLLNGNEKYEMVRNLIAIKRFVNKKGVNKDIVDSEISKLFGSVKDIKDNIAKKNDFIRKYKKIYSETENLVLKCIKKGNIR